MIGTAAAILGSAAIGAGASLWGSHQQSQASAAAAAQMAAARQKLEPYMDFGNSAMADYRKAMGGDYSGFANSPDQQFAFDQGMRGVNSLASAGGMLSSGGALKGAMQFSSGLASQNYGSYMQRLLQSIGIGAGAANAGVGASGGVANYLQGQGAANASGVMGVANAFGTGVNNYLGYNMMNNMMASRGGGTGSSYSMMPSPNGPGTYAPTYT